MQASPRRELIAAVGTALDTTVSAAPPLATGNGLRYLELAADLPPGQARRLTFLDLPDTAAHADPTNRHEVERWARISPAVASVGIDRFLCRNPHILLAYDTTEGPDDALPWLAARKLIAWPLRARWGVIEVQAPPCPR